MLLTSKIIAEVKEKFFYDNGEKQVKSDAEAVRDWHRVSEKLNITVYQQTQELWQQICHDYLNYLRHGGIYSHAAEMQFMQSHLLRSNLLDQSNHSDDVDECELERILNSDDEGEKTTTPQEAPPTPPPIKRKKAASAPSKLSVGSLNNLSSMELIFLGYAKVLQKLPRPLQLATKRKIADIMDEAEMQLEG